MTISRWVASVESALFGFFFRIFVESALFGFSPPDFTVAFRDFPCSHILVTPVTRILPKKLMTIHPISSDKNHGDDNVSSKSFSQKYHGYPYSRGYPYFHPNFFDDHPPKGIKTYHYYYLANAA